MTPFCPGLLFAQDEAEIQPVISGAAFGQLVGNGDLAALPWASVVVVRYRTDYPVVLLYMPAEDQ